MIFPCIFVCALLGEKIMYLKLVNDVSPWPWSLRPKSKSLILKVVLGLGLDHHCFHITWTVTVSWLIWKTAGGWRKSSLTTQTPLIILYHLTVTQSLQTFVPKRNLCPLDTCLRDFWPFQPAQPLLRVFFLRVFF